MSVNSVSGSNYIAPSTVITGAQSAQVNSASDPDGDGDGGVRKSRGQGRGHMQNALMQALQSLGLSPTQQTAATSSAAGASNSPQANGADSDGDNDGSTTATSGVKNDLRQLMHAVFQAVKAENANGSSSSNSTSTDPKANFASGLSALISQVSNGNAPADLQNAFSKVVTDLQTVSTTPSAAAASSSTATPQATLQVLLTQLQQNLGYGPTSSTAAIGNFLSTQG